MPTRQRPATAANSARLTNPNDRPQRRSTETFGIAHALCGAVFLCPKRNGRGGSVTLCGEWVVRAAGNASHSLRACVGTAWASVGAAGRSGSVREGRVAVRGGAKVFGGEWVVRSAGRASRSLRACVGAAWACVRTEGAIGSARGGRVAVRGRAEVFGGEWVVRSAGNASRSLRACVGAAWGSGSAREGRVAVRGRATAFGGEWVVRSASLTHIRRSRSRARVLLYTSALSTP